MVPVLMAAVVVASMLAVVVVARPAWVEAVAVVAPADAGVVIWRQLLWWQSWLRSCSSQWLWSKSWSISFGGRCVNGGGGVY